MPPSDLLFNRQFLLSRVSFTEPGWKSVQIGEYQLHAHPNLEVTTVTGNENSLTLLGYFFDYRLPDRTNQDILDQCVKCSSFPEMMREVDFLSGRFILICNWGEDLFLLQDACGQREVFYDTTFSAFGSQPKIIEEVIPGEELTDQHAIAFFQSEGFKKARIFIGDKTHRSNIHRLPPNHYLDVRRRSVNRFFPSMKLEKASTEEVAKRAVLMLKGYLQAASGRYPLEVGVTAGYDSRVLFLASLDLPVTHYVSRNEGINNTVDVDIAMQLGEMHQRSVKVREHHIAEMTQEAKAIQDRSVDFPRYRHISGKQSDHMVVNGNVSEIARSYFGSALNLSATELSRMCGYGDSPYVVQIYNTWLNTNKTFFDQLGYHYLDMFYWEERMGNWAAKGKTEAGLSVEVYPAFCARALLQLLLSTDRKDRDKQFNRLYDAMIKELSPDALKIPVNPIGKVKTIKLMKRLGVYDVYRKYGIKFGLLKR